jgi:integrase
MASIYKIYCVGGQGRFMGADGVNPILFQVLVGTAEREWFEPHYFKRSLKPLGQIRDIVPEKPNSPNALIDACIAFYPRHFENCPYCRHTATTRMIASGSPHTEVMKITGHTELKTFLHYLNITPETAKRCAACLDNYLNENDLQFAESNLIN